MTTHAQINANRANAKNSSGPKTEAGKLASSRNSLRHGCTSKQNVIPGEDPAEYEALRRELHNDFKPGSLTEATLVDQLAQYTWRLQRCRRAETAMFEKLLQFSDSDLAVANAISDPEAQLDKIRRYEVTIERSYHRAIDQLRKLQKERRALETVAAKEEQRASRERRWVDPPHAANEQTGLVSQATSGASAHDQQTGFVSHGDSSDAPHPEPAAAA